MHAQRKVAQGQEGGTSGAAAADEGARRNEEGARSKEQGARRKEQGGDAAAVLTIDVDRGLPVHRTEMKQRGASGERPRHRQAVHHVRMVFTNAGEARFDRERYQDRTVQWLPECRGIAQGSGLPLPQTV
jgi:hypothetical protein